MKKEYIYQIIGDAIYKVRPDQPPKLCYLEDIPWEPIKVTLDPSLNMKSPLDR